MLSRGLLFLPLLLCLGCGYRHVDGDSSGSIALYLPYVRGDYEGRLTMELMRELAASGIELTSSHRARYLLEVEIVSSHSDQIGYEYDRATFSDDLHQRLLANEGRRTVVARATLRDAVTQEVLLGPAEVHGEGDYDYLNGISDSFYGFTDLAGAPTSVLQFSLGQLDSIEGASVDVLTPAYRMLAQRLTLGIVRGLSSCQ